MNKSHEKMETNRTLNCFIMLFPLPFSQASNPSALFEHGRIIRYTCIIYSTFTRRVGPVDYIKTCFYMIYINEEATTLETPLHIIHNV